MIKLNKLNNKIKENTETIKKNLISMAIENDEAVFAYIDIKNGDIEYDHIFSDNNYSRIFIGEISGLNMMDEFINYTAYNEYEFAEKLGVVDEHEEATKEDDYVFGDFIWDIGKGVEIMDLIEAELLEDLDIKIELVSKKQYDEMVQYINSILFDNKNLHIDEKEKSIIIQSYNICLLEDIKYTKKVFKSIVKNKALLCEKLKTDCFKLSINGYNIDGLYETNSSLINESSEIYFNS